MNKTWVIHRHTHTRTHTCAHVSIGDIEVTSSHTYMIRDMKMGKKRVHSENKIMLGSFISSLKRKVQN